MAVNERDVLIVIPAFNESEAIADVIRDVLAAVPEAGCLVVDDGSRDNTAAVAKAAGATVLELPVNLGVGGAMRLGFTYAVSAGYSAVIQVDGDGQHDARDLPELIAALDSADLVIGARFAGKGSYDVRGPRKWAMVALSTILSRSAGATLNDTTSGFRASGPRAVALFAQHYPAEYLGDTVESLVIAIRAGMRVRQVPVEMRPRQGGNPSHSPVKAALFLARVGIAVAFAFMRPQLHVWESGESS